MTTKTTKKRSQKPRASKTALRVKWPVVTSLRQAERLYGRKAIMNLIQERLGVSDYVVHLVESGQLTEGMMKMLAKAKAR
jgi:hypothetical protein